MINQNCQRAKKLQGVKIEYFWIKILNTFFAPKKQPKKIFFFCQRINKARDMYFLYGFIH